MAIKIQYTKTAIQQYQRQLQIRVKALPTLKNKETALRLEVKRVAERLEAVKQQLKQAKLDLSNLDKYWIEFPDILRIEKVNTRVRNIAGVKIPILEDVQFKVTEVALLYRRPWITAGTEKLKSLIRMKVAEEVYTKEFEALNYARKKTTQKVNLYEKVQIPEFQSAIRQVKRYLEDKDNLEKASQKIVKERNRKKEEAL